MGCVARPVVIPYKNTGGTSLDEGLKKVYLVFADPALHFVFRQVKRFHIGFHKISVGDWPASNNRKGKVKYKVKVKHKIKVKDKVKVKVKDRDRGRGRTRAGQGQGQGQEKGQGQGQGQGQQKGQKLE